MHLSQKNSSSAFKQLNKCLDVKEWMSTSKLKLNPDKTEFIIFDLKRQRDKLKACFPIAHDASVHVANALVISRFDYCNSLFRSLSKFSLC